jgi:hypothetical protein
MTGNSATAVIYAADLVPDGFNTLVKELHTYFVKLRASQKGMFRELA